jgi:hypothetical protein
MGRTRNKRGHNNSIKPFNHDTIGELTLASADDCIATVIDHTAMARNKAIALRQLAEWATARGSRNVLQSPT